jgi:hypothetical protein
LLRLTEQYPLHTAVEIQFTTHDQWLSGHVIQHAPPGIWVQTNNGQRWFVTNSRRIRPSPSPTQPTDQSTN